jgi:hypothetical protein
MQNLKKEVAIPPKAKGIGYPSDFYMKLIIKFRGFDTDSNKIDNSKDVKRIKKYLRRFWNVEEIEEKK